MTYRIAQGIQISLDGSTWYKLSDHNRSPVSISYEPIESSQRMANGKLKKYVISNKTNIDVSWDVFPTKDTYLVDYASGVKGAAWLRAFYRANIFQPVQIKLIYAKETVPTQNNIPNDLSYVDSYSTTGEIYSVYISNFSYDVSKRVSPVGTVGYDFVDIKISFTEI